MEQSPVIIIVKTSVTYFMDGP